MARDTGFGDNAAMFLLVDGNNLAWAGYYGLERAMKPEDDERRHRVALLGLTSMTLGAIARGGAPPGQSGAPLTRVALCFDEGRPIRRRQLFPAYQTGRENDPKFMANESMILGAIAEFIDMCTQMLPVEVVRGVNTEADDLIAGLVQKYPRLDKRIVSTDRDFMQLIGPKTSIYAPVKKLIVTEETFFDAVSLKGTFPRERFLDFRALTGDASDNLPGVPGVGDITATKLLAVAPLDEYLDDPQRVHAALGRKSDNMARIFGEDATRAIVARNRTLMNLRLPAPCWDELDALTTRGAWDKAAFVAWYAEQKISAVEQATLLDRLEALAASQ